MGVRERVTKSPALRKLGSERTNTGGRTHAVGVLSSPSFPLTHYYPSHLSSLQLALCRRSFPKPQRETVGGWEEGGGATDGEDVLVIRAVTQVNSIILFSFAVRRVCPFHSQLP